MDRTSQDHPSLDQILDAVAGGSVTAHEAVEHLSALRTRRRPDLSQMDFRRPGFQTAGLDAPGFDAPDAGRSHKDSPYARLDFDREARTGMPEVIFSPGKSPQQMRSVASALLERSSSAVLATKATPEAFDAVHDLTPDAEYHQIARTIVLRREHVAPPGTITIVTAGTSDIPVAEEAAVTADACGAKVDRIFDVGVAGIHRVLAVSDDLRASDIVIVVAGMEGALPSVVGGMVRAPVIAVPTSVGYGASFGGMAALLGMLNSCAPGVAVVNIDNGFGAAAFALRLLKARA